MNSAHRYHRRSVAPRPGAVPRGAALHGSVLRPTRSSAVLALPRLWHENLVTTPNFRGASNTVYSRDALRSVADARSGSSPELASYGTSVPSAARPTLFRAVQDPPPLQRPQLPARPTHVPPTKPPLSPWPSTVPPLGAPLPPLGLNRGASPPLQRPQIHARAAYHLLADINACTSWEAAKVLFNEQRDKVTLVHLSALLGRLAKTPPPRSWGKYSVGGQVSFVNEVLAASQPYLSTADTRQLGGMLWAVGKLYHHPDTQWLMGALVRTRATLSAFDDISLGQVLWGVAKLGRHPGVSFLSAYWSVALGRLRSCSGQTLSNIIWAAATLHALPPSAAFTVDEVAPLPVESERSPQPSSTAPTPSSSFFPSSSTTSASLSRLNKPAATAGFPPVVGDGSTGLPTDAAEQHPPSSSASSAPTRQLSTTFLNPMADETDPNQSAGPTVASSPTQPLASVGIGTSRDGGRDGSSVHATGSSHSQAEAGNAGIPSLALDGAALQRVYDASYERLPDLALQGLSNVVWAYATLGVYPGQRWMEHLLATLKPRLKDCMPQDTANTVWALAKLGHVPPPAWLSVLAKQCMRHLPAFEPQELVSTYWALLMLKHTPDEWWMQVFLAAVQDRLQWFRPQEMSTLLWCLGLTRRVELPGHFQRALFHFAAPACRVFGPQDCANTLWALGTLELVPPSHFLLVMEQSTYSCMPSATTQHLSNIIWGYSRINRWPGQVWLDTFFLTTRPKLLLFKLDELAAVVYACGSGGIAPPRQWMNQLMLASYAKLPPHVSPAPRVLANLVWGVARVGFTPSTIWLTAVRGAVARCASRVNDVDARTLQRAFKAFGHPLGGVLPLNSTEGEATAVVSGTSDQPDGKLHTSNGASGASGRPLDRTNSGQAAPSAPTAPLRAIRGGGPSGIEEGPDSSSEVRGQSPQARGLTPALRLQSGRSDTSGAVVSGNATALAVPDRASRRDPASLERNTTSVAPAAPRSLARPATTTAATSSLQPLVVAEEVDMVALHNSDGQPHGAGKGQPGSSTQHQPGASKQQQAGPRKQQRQLAQQHGAPTPASNASASRPVELSYAQDSSEPQRVASAGRSVPSQASSVKAQHRPRHASAAAVVPQQQLGGQPPQPPAAAQRPTGQAGTMLHPRGSAAAANAAQHAPHTTPAAASITRQPPQQQQQPGTASTQPAASKAPPRILVARRGKALRIKRPPMVIESPPRAGSASPTSRVGGVTGVAEPADVVFTPMPADNLRRRQALRKQRMSLSQAESEQGFTPQ